MSDLVITIPEIVIPLSLDLLLGVVVGFWITCFLFSYSYYSTYSYYARTDQSIPGIVLIGMFLLAPIYGVVVMVEMQSINEDEEEANR